LKTTGNKDKTANPASRNTDHHDHAAPVSVICCRVVPAWMKTKLGGATPEWQNRAFTIEIYEWQCFQIA
jgi:hypothetical protein